MITFDKETHTYFDDGKPLISVTTLLHKHGLAPDYSMVNESVLSAKAERGTLIHKEIQDYIEKGKLGFTSELFYFQEMVEEYGFKNMVSEQVCHNDIVAGTVDFQADSDNGTVIADFKTCATINKEYVRWQLSLYAKLLGKKFDHYYIIHLQAEKGAIIEVSPIDDKEIEELLNCEFMGEIYSQKGLVVPCSMLEQTAYVLLFTLKLKEYEKKYKKLQAEWTKLMAEQGIKTFENDDMKVTFVDESVRYTIDTKALAEDYPDIVKKYKVKSKIAPNVRIKSKIGDMENERLEK